MATSSLTAYADAEAINTALLATLARAPRLPHLHAHGHEDPWLRLLPHVRVTSLRTTLDPDAFEWARGPLPRSNVGFRLTVALFEIPIAVEIEIAARIAAFEGNIVLADASARALTVADPTGDRGALFEPAYTDLCRRALAAGAAPEIVDPLKGLTADAVAGIVQSIAPSLARLVLDVPPIQVHQLYGGSLEATLWSVDVVRAGREPMVQVVAKIAGDEGAPAPLLLRPEMVLPREEPPVGRIIFLVSEGAFNHIAGALLREQDKHHDIDVQERVLGTKLAVTSEVTIERIKVRISSNAATARAKLRFKQAHARVRVGPLRAWTPVDIKSAKARVSIKLKAEDGEGYVVFKGIDELEVRLRQRELLAFTAPFIGEVLDEALRPVLNVLFDGKRFEVFRLPKTLPGRRDVPIKLAFQRDGLRFWPGIASFQVSIEPPLVSTPGAPPPLPPGNRSAQ